jgi:hypothetical protein
MNRYGAELAMIEKYETTEKRTDQAGFQGNETP